MKTVCSLYVIFYSAMGISHRITFGADIQYPIISTLGESLRSKYPSGNRLHTITMYTIVNTLNSTRSMIFPKVRHKLVLFAGFSLSCDSTRLMSSSVPLSLLSVCCEAKRDLERFRTVSH